MKIIILLLHLVVESVTFHYNFFSLFVCRCSILNASKICTIFFFHFFLFGSSRTFSFFQFLSRFSTFSTYFFIEWDSRVFIEIFRIFLRNFWWFFDGKKLIIIKRRFTNACREENDFFCCVVNSNLSFEFKYFYYDLLWVSLLLIDKNRCEQVFYFKICRPLILCVTPAI